MSTIHATNTDQEVDVHAPASTYYTSGFNSGTEISRIKTFQVRDTEKNSFRKRRASHDDKNKAQKFLLDVKETLKVLVEQEDTDGDFQITVNDLGPKTFTVGTADSGGYRTIDIRGTYVLSNLLQELAIAKDFGRKHIVLDEARLNENPVDRLSRMIRNHFWDGLTRRMDAEAMEIICKDPKNRSDNTNPRIYIPYDDDDAFNYYQQVADHRQHLKLEVVRLPPKLTPEFVQSINECPGILALAMKRTEQGLKSVPFVVPGGRFNEMYGWDSYFIALGLLSDNRIDLAQAMVDNFVYQIKHYGKILNANRSYYLSRSQPPFLTDMALRVYDKLPQTEENKTWLQYSLSAAIQEYNTVWVAEPRLDPKTGLSRFRPAGKGIPPETEASHFDHVIQPYATQANMTINDYMNAYNEGSVVEPELDEYFLHDRAVRESGHDTTYRYEKRCANLATIDLNALLYKYETDLADAIRDIFEDDFVDDDGKHQSAMEWTQRAKDRRERIDKYLWNEEKGLYYDYDTVMEQQCTYDSVTAFWAMWAQCASMEQAQRMTELSLHKFEELGGLVSGTEESRGVITLDRPNRQWDFPFGWAPHQIMAWRGFENYDMPEIARRLAYRWLYTITKSFVDFNGVVPEKYDVVSMTHQVQVEYGNVGTDFKYVTREGFGWMNASYQLGLKLLTTQMRRALGMITDPDLFFEKIIERQHKDAHRRRRKSSVAAAKKITKNGQIIAAITTFTHTSSSTVNTPSTEAPPLQFTDTLTQEPESPLPNSSLSTSSF
ncbi:trehalase-domain-containing protein [Circinella umbellata]|nr:trehalase-domain-containing protein [Circinella umbellata]